MDEEPVFEFEGLNETERILAVCAPIPLFLIITMLLAVFGNCAHFRTDKCSVILCFAFRWLVVVMVGAYIVILYLLVLGIVSVASPVISTGAPDVFLFGILSLIAGSTALCALCMCGGIRIGASEEEEKYSTTRGGESEMSVNERPGRKV